MLVSNEMVLLGGLKVEVAVEYKAVESGGFVEEVAVDHTVVSYEVTVEDSAEGSAGGEDEVSGPREVEFVAGQKVLVSNELVLFGGLEVTVEYHAVDGGGFVERVAVDKTVESYEVTVDGSAEGDDVDVTAVSSSLGDGEYVEPVVLGWNVVVAMLLLEIGLVVEEYMDVDVAAV